MLKHALWLIPYEEAVKAAHNMLENVLAAYIDYGLDLPVPTS
ncbi:hypothetical protein SeseC_00401 [Streptococcus equi subsp. zooepidemicus ATCC 35246]|nr:hypothetical protein SeseC_00401 [Streptococcus equi subsp. zooepidemicus ATCC 35246]